MRKWIKIILVVLIAAALLAVGIGGGILIERNLLWPTKIGALMVSPKEVGATKAAMTNRFAEIGVELTTKDGQTVVDSVAPNKPGDIAGIKPGDTVIPTFGGWFLVGENFIMPLTPKTIVVEPEDIQEFTPLFESYALLKEYFYGDLPLREKIVEGAIEGIIKVLPPELGEFTYYENPAEAEVGSAQMEGRYAGIGVYLTEENSQLIIGNLFPGGPAEKAELKVGDTILAVNGEGVAGVTWEIRHGLFRGEPGTEVIISIRRVEQDKDTGAYLSKNIDITVVREVIETPAVRTVDVIEESVGEEEHRLGYIHLTIFSESAPDEIWKALKQLLEVDKVEGLILDLRGNPGGRQLSANLILSQFLPGGKVATQIITRERTYDLTTYPGGLATKIPLVVLIDQGSASSSEWVAGAIQYYERGTLVGSTTLGKGVGQTPRTLSDGSMIMVVDHEFRTPDGRVVHGVGIEPDEWEHTTPYQRIRGEDPARDRGIEILLEEIDK